MTGTTIPLHGKLEEHALASVLRMILTENRVGCLAVSRGTITRRLYLREGMIVYGSSTEKLDRLGEILVTQGKLSRADYKKYWEQSRAENRLLGITLVLNGRITLSDLFQGVTAQVVTILERLQKWRTGAYEFEEGREPDAGTVLLRIPLALYLRADAGKKQAKEAKPPAKTKRPSRRVKAMPEPSATPPPTEEQEIAIPEVESAVGALPSGADFVLEQAAFEGTELVSEVAFHVQELRKRTGQSPYALLGVMEEADFAVAQQAYYRLAKVLHPDRLPPQTPAEVAREAGDLFREVAAAFQTLSDLEARRKAGPAAAAAAGVFPGRGVRPNGESEDQAKRQFLQGRDFITKGNYWQAASALRQAVRLRPDETSYRRLLGLALVQTKRLHEAEEHVQEAIRIEPSNADNFVTLGRVYTTGRLYRKAREAYQRALRIDPRSAAAREELDALPEEPPPEKKSGVSFIKKLFGKG